MEPKVKVRITATERVCYDKVIEIPASALAEYEAVCESKTGRAAALWFSQFADKYLDPMNDVCDGDEYEDVEVTKLK